MPHIFISYAKKDTRPLAEELFITINGMEGFSAWMDKSLEAGGSWASQIQEEIQHADLVLVLLSPDINRRPSETQRRSFVLNEIDFAQQLHKPILPIMAQQTISPVQIAGVEYIDFTKNEQQGMERLLEHLLDDASLTIIEEDANFPEVDKFQSALPQTSKEGFPDFKSISEKIEDIFNNLVEYALGLWLGIMGIVFLAIIAVLIFTQFNGSYKYPPDVANAIHYANRFNGYSNSIWQPVYHNFGTETGTMVLVPKGCLPMGNDSDAQHYSGTEWLVAVPAAGEQCFDTFWIDVREVNQAHFQALEGSKQLSSSFQAAQHPVNRITWFEANEFCERQGKRLPTEAEWEYAARGVDGWLYPWGNDWDETYAVWNRDLTLGPDDVGILREGASWVGAYDMAGNVWEWTHSISRDYPYHADDGREALVENFQSIRYVVRGGSWDSTDSALLRSATRFSANPTTADSSIGFRCVRDIDPLP